MLNFVKHVLESSIPSLQAGSLGEDLNYSMLNRQSSADSDQGDSDDDMPDSEIRGTDDEMVETALNLLLSILEGENNARNRNKIHFFFCR